MQNNTEPSLSKSAKYSCKECQEFLDVLQIVLDNEADDAQIAFVNEHVDSCSYCFECYEIDRTLRQTIRQKIQKINTPQELTALIQAKIQTLIE